VAGVLDLVRGLRAADIASQVPTCFVGDQLAVALEILAMRRAPRRIVLIDRGRRVRGVITALRVLEVLLGFRGESIVRGSGLARALREEVYVFSDEAPYTMEVGAPLPAVIKHMGVNNISTIPLVDSVGIYRGAVTEKEVAALSRGRVLGLRVSEALEEYPVISMGESVLSASDAMIRARKGKAVVVDRGGRAVGVVTASDILRMPFLTEEIIEILRADAGASFSEILSRIPVTRVMSSPAITISGEEDLGAAADLFADNDIGILPVVGDDNRVAGVVSRMGIVRILAGML